MEYQPRDTLWTPETIRRFWENYVTADTEDSYFSHVRGKAILAQLPPTLPSGPLLDLGCGTGALAAHALARGWRVVGMDVSEAGVAKVNARFAGQAGWLGAKSGALGALPYADAEFAAITLVETIEHLVPVEIPGILAEMRRVLMPGGAVLVTTPNEEDLDAAKVRCPDCGSRFHRIQHLQAFSAATLRVLMEKAGFQTVRCEGTLLDRDPPSLVERLYRFRHRLRGTGKLPHLVYVGRKGA